MIETEIGLRRTIQSWRTHGNLHAYSTSLFYSSLSFSLGYSCRHSLVYHLACHRLHHRIIHLALDGIADRRRHRFIKEHWSVGLQPLLGEEST